jgi:CubicO group peptidase (beta-lactamase class C family)
MERQRIPGLSLAVVKDGKIVLAKGYGLANVELNVHATSETVYEIGSVTKQFTATAVMMLVEEGKIGLDEKITKCLYRHVLAVFGGRHHFDRGGFGEMESGVGRTETVETIQLPNDVDAGQAE